MIDWTSNIRSRNYGIKRQTDRRNLSDLLTISASALLLAGSFGLYAWVRCTIVDIGYQEQTLIREEEDQIQLEKNLILQEQTLNRPERIEFIAENELGMVRVRTNQLMPPSLQNVEPGGTTTLALAAAPSSATASRKQSASN